MTAPRPPLSAEDLDVIAAALDEGPGEGFAWCAGHATGSLTTPKPPTEGEWVASMLGNAQADLRATHLAALYQDLAQLVPAGEVCPPPPDDELSIQQWCEGFAHGIGHDDSWFEDFAAMDMVKPFAVLAGHEDLEGYLDPEDTSRVLVGRNDPCPCGSRKKYKHCCMP